MCACAEMKSKHVEWSDVLRWFCHLLLKARNNQVTWKSIKLDIFLNIRLVKEALCIQSMLADLRFNRDGRYELLDCWFALNQKLRGGAIVGHRAPPTGRMRSIT